MSNTVTFPNKIEIEKQAADWLAAIDRGLSEYEKNALDEWLAESLINGETLVHFAAYWDKMDMLSAVAKVLPLDPNNKTLELNRAMLIGGCCQRNLKPRLMHGVSLASVIILAVGVLLSVFASDTFRADSAEVYYSAVYQTAVGDQSTVTMPDGSALTLNTATEVRVNFSDSRREVELVRGEAFFDVAKNQHIPFVVVVGDDVVTAVGTAFNIERRGVSGFDVLVTEGVVKVEQQSDASVANKVLDQPAAIERVQPVFLAIGEQLSISPSVDETVQTRDLEAIDVELAWRRGMLIFEGDSLESALAEISRYTSLTLVIEDSTIKDVEVGGYFKAGDMDELLIALDRNFGIKYRQLGNQLLFSAR